MTEAAGGSMGETTRGEEISAGRALCPVDLAALPLSEVAASVIGSATGTRG